MEQSLSKENYSSKNSSTLTSETPWSTVGYLVAKRTYARRLDEDDPASPTEEWDDIVERIVRATNEQLNIGFTEAEQERLRFYHKRLKGTVAGRFLWQLGTSTVDRLGLASLQNCAFTVVDSPRAFAWTMDLLMLGSGVGYNIQREFVDKLPPVAETFKTPTRITKEKKWYTFWRKRLDFVVPDSREGWVELLEYTLDCAFNGGSFTYSTKEIRPKGSPIRGFGGVASGPEPLVAGINKISRVLENRRGQYLRPIDCLDIMNIIGELVVAGNVRRSAQIAIGDADDLEFLRAKRWDLGSIPSWRAMSNNSVVVADISNLHSDFWEGYQGNGEPYGLINLDLSRRTGRTGPGGELYPDPTVAGYNPCAEQSLADKETCCLAEFYLPNVESFDELVDLSKLLYRICKHSLSLSCHLPETEAIVHSNFRMGIGCTGYLQASEEQRQWLPKLYPILRDYDEKYSAEHGLPISVKLTTVKPSGTLSLLPGVTPGAHPAYAQYMIRRVTLAANSPLVAVIKAHGYNVEDYTWDASGNTVVAEFPFSYPRGTALASEMSAIDQLEVIKRLQREWSDNSVSCTVYYKKEELPEIRKYLEENYADNFKSLSFLLHSDHGFDQAPLEEITKEHFDEMMSKVKLITSANAVDSFEGSFECEGGVCPVR